MKRNEPASWMAVTATVVALGASSCSSDRASGSGPGPEPEPTARRMVVAGTDFQVVGSLATIDLDTYAVETHLEDVSSDPVVRVTGGELVVVNRFQFDNLQVVDPSNGFATEAQFSTGNGSNPHDVVVRGREAFVTRYEPPFDDVLVMSLDDGRTLDTIDLEPYADTATDPGVLPRADRIVESNGLLYVLLQQFDASFAIVGTGTLVVIDPDRRQVVGSIPLSGQSPGSLAPLGADLIVGMSGLYFPLELTGGIDRVSTASRTARSVVDDDTLGGNVSSLAVVSDHQGYAVVAKPDAQGVPANVNEVVSFDPSSGSVGTTVFQCPAFLPGIGFDGEHSLVVLCRDPVHPGVWLIDTRTDTVLAGPIDVGLPPLSLAFLP